MGQQKQTNIFLVEFINEELITPGLMLLSVSLGNQLLWQPWQLHTVQILQFCNVTEKSIIALNTL